MWVKKEGEPWLQEVEVLPALLGKARELFIGTEAGGMGDSSQCGTF